MLTALIPIPYHLIQSSILVVRAHFKSLQPSFSGTAILNSPCWAVQGTSTWMLSSSYWGKRKGYSRSTTKGTHHPFAHMQTRTQDTGVQSTPAESQHSSTVGRTCINWQTPVMLQHCLCCINCMLLYCSRDRFIPYIPHSIFFNVHIWTIFLEEWHFKHKKASRTCTVSMWFLLSILTCMQTGKILDHTRYSCPTFCSASEE